MEEEEEEEEDIGGGVSTHSQLKLLTRRSRVNSLKLLVNSRKLLVNKQLQLLTRRFWAHAPEEDFSRDLVSAAARGIRAGWRRRIS